MAARLEWAGNVLRLGPFEMGRVLSCRTGWIPAVNQSVATVREEKSDAMQDAESEVRRLLKDAGVEVE